MKDKEQARKKYIKELYEEKIIIDSKLKELLKRHTEIEKSLYWLDDEESINYLYEINLTNKK